MKTKNLFAIFAIAALVSVSFTSCEKESDPAPQAKIVTPVVPPVVAPHPYLIDTNSIMAMEEDLNSNTFIIPYLVENEDTLQVVRLRFVTDGLYVEVWNVGIDTTGASVIVTGVNPVDLANSSFIRDTLNTSTLNIRTFEGVQMTKIIDYVSATPEEWVLINGNYFMNQNFLVELFGFSDIKVGVDGIKQLTPELVEFAMVNKNILNTKIKKTIEF
jgi:hypothetical protein